MNVTASMLLHTPTHKVSVGDKQVLCLIPTVPAVPSVSSIIISNIIVTILFGDAAQTGGAGVVAVVKPPPTVVELSAVPAVSILVPVPGQIQVVSFIFICFHFSSKFD